MPGSGVATKEDFIKSRDILKDVARQAGWLFSEAKEQEPSRCCRFLGYNLNTQNMKFEVPEDKLEKALAKIKVLLEAGQRPRKKITSRQLAKVVGLLCSFYRAYPGFSRLMLRSCYATMEKTREEGGWDQYITLKAEARDELAWWKENLRSLNGGCMKQEVQELATGLGANLYGDASGTGLYLY